MANLEHLGILKQGVTEWNQWREDNPEVRPDLIRAKLGDADLRRVDLSQADLIEANLQYADFNEANLSEANLRYANLRYANLRYADLRRANLRYVDLSEANLNEADLSEADLSQVDLRYANLREADLRCVNFSQVRIGRTTLVDVDLSTTKGLDTVEHTGPSSIGIDTIYKSYGDIPEIFLRKAGVHEDFITYMSSLTGNAFDYYSCFICYASPDQEFAERLYADLQSKGVRCWYAPEDMKIGDKIRDRLDQTIRIHDKLLLVLSEHSINSSWVEMEVETALAEERRQKRPLLFPVRLDGGIQETEASWARQIWENRHIGDFTHWKDHDSYQAVFERLISDLQAESS